VIARAATLVPIVIGPVEAFGRPLRSQVGKAMLLLAGILPSVTGVGVLTGAAPNPVLVNFLTAAGEPFSSSCLLVRIAKWIAPPPDEPRWLNLELTENKLTPS